MLYQWFVTRITVEASNEVVFYHDVRNLDTTSNSKSN